MGTHAAQFVPSASFFSRRVFRLRSMLDLSRSRLARRSQPPRRSRPAFTCKPLKAVKSTSELGAKPLHRSFGVPWSYSSGSPLEHGPVGVVRPGPGRIPAGPRRPGPGRIPAGPGRSGPGQIPESGSRTMWCNHDKVLRISSHFIQGICILKNYLISGLNGCCKRKKTPENSYLDGSSLLSSYIRTNRGTRLHCFTLATEIPNFCHIVCRPRARCRTICPRPAQTPAQTGPVRPFAWRSGRSERGVPPSKSTKYININVFLYNKYILVVYETVYKILSKSIWLKSRD